MPIAKQHLIEALSFIQERDMVAAAIGKSSVSLGPGKGYSEGEGLLGQLGQLTGRKRWVMSALTAVTDAGRAAKKRIEAQAKENGRPFRVEALRIMTNTDTEMKAITATLKEARAQLSDTESNLSRLQAEVPELKTMSVVDIQSTLDLLDATGEDSSTTDQPTTRLATEASTQEEHDVEVDNYLGTQS